MKGFLSAEKILTFTEALAEFIGAGLPVAKSLRLLSERFDFAEEAANQVERGKSLSSALQGFPDFYVEFLRAGEETGRLQNALQTLGELFRKLVDFKRRMTSATVYPYSMLFLSCALILGFLSFAIPPLAELVGREEGIFKLAKTVRENSIVVFSLLIVSFAVPPFMLKSKLFFTFSEARISLLLRALQCGFSSGLGAIRSLSISISIVPPLRAMIEQAIKGVASGLGLHKAMEGFPEVIREIVRIGEETGRIDESLGKAAELFERRFEEKLEFLRAITEPLMIVLVGCIVLAFVLGIYIPLLSSIIKFPL